MLIIRELVEVLEGLEKEREGDRLGEF